MGTPNGAGSPTGERHRAQAVSLRHPQQVWSSREWDETFYAGSASHYGVDRLPYPRPPWPQINELVASYLGPVRRAGQGLLLAGTASGEAEIMLDAGYTCSTVMRAGPHQRGDLAAPDDPVDGVGAGTIQARARAQERKRSVSRAGSRSVRCSPASVCSVAR